LEFQTLNLYDTLTVENGEGIEKKLYRDTFECIRKRADEKFPDKLLYSQQEAADIRLTCKDILSKRQNL
jgi:hypothetical protein